MAFEKCIAVADMAGRDWISLPNKIGPVALFRVGDEFYAMEDKCSHARWALTKGPYANGVIECELHKARFCVKTGAALCLPATKPVKIYPVKIEAGDIYVDFEAGYHAGAPAGPSEGEAKNGVA